MTSTTKKLVQWIHRYPTNINVVPAGSSLSSSARKLSSTTSSRFVSVDWRNRRDNGTAKLGLYEHHLPHYNHQPRRNFHNCASKLFRVTSIEQQQNQQTSSSPPQQRPSSTSLAKADFDYCVDLVQNRDRESYLCGLLLPADARKAYFAVRAFNVEIASIKGGSVSRQAGGAQFAGYEGTDASAALRIRMQWWRDAIGQIYNDNNETNQNTYADAANDTGNNDHSKTFFDSMAASYMKNPVVRVLDYAVHQKQLTRRFLERLLESRESDLESKQPATLDEAVTYADETFASLLYLSLETCDVRDDKADIVAQHAGIGIGLTTSLRAAPWIILQDGECSIPQELIPQQFPYHKLYSYYEDATTTSGNPSNESTTSPTTAKLTNEERQMLRDAVEQIAVLAYSHLSMAQKLQDDIPKQAKTCLLPVIPALHYLTRLEQAKYDIFDESVFTDPRSQQQQSSQQQRGTNLGLLLQLGRSWLTGRI